ncbi:MAG TPA: autorepressor SdpR family transcription factor [Gemmatimonadaceae bacterium]|nr:autorepressor SdpR family transcription factor [Gemmatimonadaceae bacterium]
MKNSVFKALADPTRREILRLLRDGPHTSGEIAEHFTSSWPTVSRHLGVLRDAELILAERNGQQISYELNTTVLDDVIAYMLDWKNPVPRARRPKPSGGKRA